MADSEELEPLIARGRAEIFGDGARTPAAFAGAILHRGVDAGIQEFRRFVLGRTTSANTFESRFEGSFRLPSESLLVVDDSQSHNYCGLPNVIDCVLGLVERFPGDRDQQRAALLRRFARTHRRRIRSIRCLSTQPGSRKRHA